MDGDAAVVGMLRPGSDRCLLALFQFANRPAKVSVTLREAIDAPAASETLKSRWTAHELIHSIVDDAAIRGDVSAVQPVEMCLAPFGFRVFELNKQP